MWYVLVTKSTQLIHTYSMVIVDTKLYSVYNTCAISKEKFGRVIITKVRF